MPFNLLKSILRYKIQYISTNKDGKLRINAPHVVSMRNTALNMNCFIQGRELFYKTCVFNLKGKLLNEMALHSLESFFEKYISDLLDGIQTQNTSDEW